MRNSSSQFKRAYSLKDGEMNGVHGESPLHNFVKAKQKINSTFGDIGKYLENCNNFLADCKISDDNNEEIKKFSTEVCVFDIKQVKKLLSLCKTCNLYVSLIKLKFITFIHVLVKVCCL